MKDCFIDNGHQAANDSKHWKRGSKWLGPFDCSSLGLESFCTGVQQGGNSRSLTVSLTWEGRPGNPNRSKYSELTGQSTENEGAIERQWGLWRSAKGLPWCWSSALISTCTFGNYAGREETNAKEQMKQFSGITQCWDYFMFPTAKKKSSNSLGIGLNNSLKETALIVRQMQY